MKKRKKIKDSINVKGFFRIQLENPDGKIVGDSGWVKNTVTNQGFQLYLAHNVGKSSGSKQIAYVAIGTGGAPNVTDTTLAGEISGSTKRKAGTYSNVSSKTAQFVATFGSTDSFLSGASNISNIGLYSTTDTSDILFAGNTYASSSCNTNQNVNVTYQIRFS